MKYTLKRLNLTAGKPIVFVHTSDASSLNIHPGDRVRIRHGSRAEIAVVDVTKGFLKKGELALSREIADYLKASPLSKLELYPVNLASSSLFLKERMRCEPYTKDQLKKIVKDIIANALSEAEIAYFISGVAYCGMSLEETSYLIDAIVSTGRKISWDSKEIADKHSIGGIPGNRTTPIIVSICAAAGVIMPKTSSRAITSAAGTADTMETLTRVDLSLNEMKAVVKKTGACLAWGGALGLAPADDKLIQVEKMLGLDPEPQLLASILSKKVAAGSKYVLIDIPYGFGAKVSHKEAFKLKKKFFILAKKLRLIMDVVLTDGSQPIGNGIGPSLEMRDVLRVLARNNPPRDLEQKSLFLAGKILELVKKTPRGTGRRLAKKILNNGSALKKFEEIITAQGGSLHALPEAKFKKTLLSSINSRIVHINNRGANQAARIAGCPQDKLAGLYLHAHVGTRVKKGEPLVTIYAESEFKLKSALQFIKENHPIQIESKSL